MKTPLLIKPYPRNGACYTRWSLRQHNSCRRWRVQDHCTFCFECHHHKLESTRQTETIRRPVCLFLSHRLQCMVRESSPGLLTKTTYSIQSHHNKLPTCSSSTQASRTCTGLRIAQVKLFAHTILAAICRRRVAAISALTPTATSFRAWTKRGPAAVHVTVLCQAICNATDACSVSDGDCTVFKIRRPHKKQFARTTPDQNTNNLHLHKLVRCTLSSRRPCNPCRRSQVQDCCKLYYESRRHKLLSTRRTETSHRQAYCPRSDHL